MPNCGLQSGMNIAEEKKFRICVFRRNARLEALEDVQFGEIGFGFVQVVEILPAPAEGFSFGVFDASSIDLSFLQNVFVLGGKVFAHHGDDANIREVAGGQGKICTGTAEHIFHATRRRSNGVKGN